MGSVYVINPLQVSIRGSQMGGESKTRGAVANSVTCTLAHAPPSSCSPGKVDVLYYIHFILLKVQARDSSFGNEE